MKKLLLATHNQAKLEELKLGIKNLEKHGIKILTLNDVGVEKEPEESGKTFCQNAQIKAKFYSQITSLPTIADDGGLIIPSLGGEPGVKSKYWLGYEVSDEELINYTLSKLKAKKGIDRVAYIQTCLCFFLPKNIHPLQFPVKILTKTKVQATDKNLIIYQQEKIKGYIAQKPSGRPTLGYPFRALFIVDKFNKYYDDLTKEEHFKTNHRLKALKKLIEKIEKYLLQ